MFGRCCVQIGGHFRPNVDHVSVYKSTLPNGDKNPFGVYGHGPMITK